MKPILLSIGLTVFLATVAPVHAQSTPSEWAGKLGSRSYAEREQAARALEQLGKAALPALRDALLTADLETKRRAILIMERIEDRLLIEELTTASSVRWQFQDLAIDDALREIEKQSGLRCGNVVGKRRIGTFDSGVLPYWLAWRSFCTAGELQENDFARSSTRLKRLIELKLMDVALTPAERDIRRPFASPPVNFATAPSRDGYAVDVRHSVRVRLKWHALDDVLDLKTPHAVFAVEVRAEPRLEIMIGPRAEITKIVDDQAQSRTVRTTKLYPDASRQADASFLAAYTGEIQYGGLLQFKAIPWQGAPCSLKEVHGHIRMEVMVRPRMMEIPILAKNIAKEVLGLQGVTMKILEMEASDDGELLLRVGLDNLDSLLPETPEQQIVRVRPGMVAVRGAIDVAMERLELIDGTGRKCQPIRARYERAMKSKGYEAELVFAATTTKIDGLTLVMRKAPRIVPLEIPFLVRDVVWMPNSEMKEK